MDPALQRLSNMPLGHMRQQQEATVVLPHFFIKRLPRNMRWLPNIWSIKWDQDWPVIRTGRTLGTDMMPPNIGSVILKQPRLTVRQQRNMRDHKNLPSPKTKGVTWISIRMPLPVFNSVDINGDGSVDYTGGNPMNPVMNYSSDPCRVATKVNNAKKDSSNADVIGSGAIAMGRGRDDSDDNPEAVDKDYIPDWDEQGNGLLPWERNRSTMSQSILPSGPSRVKSGVRAIPCMTRSWA